MVYANVKIQVRYKTLDKKTIKYITIKLCGRDLVFTLM
jgi:hypothetical protein